MQLSTVLLPLLEIGAPGNDRNITSYIDGWNSTGEPMKSVSSFAFDSMYMDPISNDSIGYHTNNSILELTTKTARNRRFRRPPRLPTNALLETIDQIVMPVALSIGIVGNILIFPIFAYTPLRKSSLSHFFAAVAVSDFLYLVSCLIIWVSKKGLGLDQTIGVCQINSFVLRLSRFLGTWYLFAAHVERLLVHFSSLRARAWCSTFRAKFIILFIFVFSLVGFIHYIWTHVVIERNGMFLCTLMPESIKHIIELWKIEVVAALFLPMYLIVVIDIALIVNAIVRRQRIYLRVPSKNENVKNESNQDDRGEYTLARGQRSESIHNRSGDSSSLPPELDISLEMGSATITVVIAGLIFIGLLLPSSLSNAKVRFVPNSKLNRQDLITMELFEQLVKFNSVYKFLLYSIFLGSFRHGLVYLFRCRRKKKPVENSLQETTEV